MSDTPRTNENENAHAFLEQYGYESSLQDPPVDWAKFSSQLERELATVTEQRDESVNNYETSVLREHRMQEQRDRLAEAMESMWPFIEEDDHPNCNTTAFSMAIAKYKEALAAVKGGGDE